MDASFTDASDPSSSDTFTAAMPRLVVFGARGFVGSHIAQEGLNVGLAVTGVSRSGALLRLAVLGCYVVCRSCWPWPMSGFSKPPLSPQTAAQNPGRTHSRISGPSCIFVPGL